MRLLVRKGNAPLILFPFFLILLTGSGFVTSGCSGTFGTVKHDSEVDSLRVINRRLAAEVRVLSDSLAVFSGIESGQYFRDFRDLQENIGELDYKLAVCLDGGRVLNTQLVDELFAPASATLTDAGKRLLDERLVLLVDVLTTRELRVHGHSDTSKPGAAMAKIWPTNWELSAARASAVAQYIIEKFDVAPNRIAAVGFGDARPVESDLTPEGRKQNRRIELVAL